MLLEFRAKNYKSFRDELVFSLVPAKKQRDLSYSILRETAGGKEYKGLCSAVIYGANASGKTNIIGAIDTFRSIVLHGHIRNTEETAAANVASSKLELIPNNTLKEAAPVFFAIKFTTEKLLIDYSLSVDLGIFLEEGHPRKILNETLSINGAMVFSRSESVHFGDLKAARDFFNKGLGKNLEAAQLLAKGNLNPEELFLVNGFKNIFSPELVSVILAWFEKKLMVIYRADATSVVPYSNSFKENQVVFEKNINEAAKCFGINSNALAYLFDSNRKDVRLVSVFADGKESVAIPAAYFESLGTLRLTNLFPLVMIALQNGGTLVADEFDASLHPMALMNLINIFHNDEINVHHAQLVFNTHNPIFLNGNLFRRDEIKFVERDDTHSSSHYSLSDFGTTGSSGARKGEDYMKNYFVDRYGAIRDVDFSPIFESLKDQKGEK